MQQAQFQKNANIYKNLSRLIFLKLCPSQIQATPSQKGLHEHTRRNRYKPRMPENKPAHAADCIRCLNQHADGTHRKTWNHIPRLPFSRGVSGSKNQSSQIEPKRSSVSSYSAAFCRFKRKLTGRDFLNRPHVITRSRVRQQRSCAPSS